MSSVLRWLRQERTRTLVLLALIILLPLAAASAYTGARQLITDADPCDLTPYWVSARLARAGANPYATYAQDMALVRAQVPDSPDFVTRCNVTIEERPPLTTPTHILLMLPFSFLDLRGAAIAWALLQIVSAVLLVPILLRYHEQAPGWRITLLGVLLLLAWSPTRMAISHGQITLLVTLFASLSLLLARRGREVWAGIFLGLALSKFTLVGAVLIVLVVYRHYRTLGVAVLVQLAGFVLLALVVGESPVTTLQSYLSLVTTGADVQAPIISGVISLDRWVGMLGLSATAASLVTLLTGVLIGLALLLPRYLGELLAFREPAGPRDALALRRSNLLLNALVPLTLLFTYHRTYDLVFLFVFVALLAGLELPAEPGPRQRRCLAVWLATALVLNAGLIAPPSLLGRLFGLEDAVMTVLVSGVLVVSTWLLYSCAPQPAGGAARRGRR